MIITPRSGRHELPRCPPEIQEVVELYARESNRTGKVVFVPGGGWMARFSLRPNDKRMLLYQQGQAPEPPVEDVWFHRPVRGGRPGDFEPMDISEMGPSGVRAFLEKGNMWSGRGEFDSPEEQLKKVRKNNQQQQQKVKAEERENNRIQQREKRRRWLGIPLVGVGADLTEKDTGNPQESET